MAKDEQPQVDEYNRLAAAATSSPETIVNEAIDLIQKHSIQNCNPDGTPFEWFHKPAEKVDWDKLRGKAIEDLHSVEAPGIVDACGVVGRVLMRLHDGHSLMVHPSYERGCLHADAVDKISWKYQKEHYSKTPEPPPGDPRPTQQAMPTAEYVGNGDILHVTVPWFFVGLPGADRAAFQGVIRDALLEAAEKKVKGVIVDLRENRGGSMCPMITGLSPLLGPGPIGYFKGPNKNEMRDVNYGPPEYAIDLKDPANFPLVDTPVAVLCGKNTCSSGEITFLSFSGRPNTQSFGTPTWGNSSGNGDYSPQSEKDLKLYLCSSVAQDRNGKGDGGPLRPDVITQDPLKEALQWIQQGAPALQEVRRPKSQTREPGL